MDPPGSPNQEGPSEAPPRLPEGWLAQWDGNSRKYCGRCQRKDMAKRLDYVQRATGHSQWDVPTQPALSVPTPEPTPQAQSPFSKPENPEYEGADRSLLGDLALGALGDKHNQKPQSGLEGIASSLLGSGQHHGSNAGSGGGPSGGGLAGQLIGSFLSGGKPHSQQSQSNASGFQGPSSGSQSHGGLSGMASSLFGGNHSSSNQNSYGYTSTGQTGSGGYSGQPPPSAYTPSNQSSGQSGYATASHMHTQQTGQSTTPYASQPFQQPFNNQPQNQFGSSSSTPAAYSQQIPPSYPQQTPAYTSQQSGQYGNSNSGYGGNLPYQQSGGNQQASYGNVAHQANYQDQYNNPYPAQNPSSQSQYSYLPAPNSGGQAGSYSSPAPPPPVNTHPSSQAASTMGSGGSATHQTYGSSSYPGQPTFPPPPGHAQAHGGGYGDPSYSGAYGGPEHVTHGGQSGSGQYQAFGAPPPPAWR